MTSESLLRSAQRAVLLPGTGSDHVLVRRVFEGPLAMIGLGLVTPVPQPGPALVKAHLAALDAAAADGPIVAGGISLGAHLAAEWALRNRDRCVGLLLALPAWHGPDIGAPAAAAARYSAAVVDALGMDGALEVATRDVAPWLATELSRAWRGYGAELADSLRVAADHPAPALDELSTLTLPAGIATCVDDPVHPTATAYAWAGALPRSAVCETTLAALGVDAESLGRATVLALLRASTLA